MQISNLLPSIATIYGRLQSARLVATVAELGSRRESCHVKVFSVSNWLRGRLWVLSALMVAIGLLLTWARSHFDLSRRGRALF